jgi:hypothetical protein
MKFRIPDTGAKQCLWVNIIIRRQFIYQLAVVPKRLDLHMALKTYHGFYCS